MAMRIRDHKGEYTWLRVQAKSRLRSSRGYAIEQIVPTLPKGPMKGRGIPLSS